MSGLVAESRPILIVTGVSGSGKSTIAGRLAGRLGWLFAEGDDFHPAENIAKMRDGVPLDDRDRAPWLARIAAWIDERRAAGTPGIVTCSALRRNYRDELARGRPEVVFVYLKISAARAAARVAERKNHFMPALLIGSQFAALEEPRSDESVVIVDADQPPEAIVDQIIGRLQSRSADVQPKRPVT
jgi:gluconokinase